MYILPYMSKKTPENTRDPRKEKIYRLFASVLAEAGMQVRREELKRGYGWKTMSGTCRLLDSKVVFVDRRMPQEEQNSFLAGIISNKKLSISDQTKKELEHLEVAI